MTRSKARTIGVIVEDRSDFCTIREFVSKIPSNKQIVLRGIYCKGCGRITSKSQRMVSDLEQKSCSELIIVRDLDENDESTIRREITEAFGSSPITRRVIIIPIKTIEAWLLSDMNAIKKVYHFSKLNLREIPNTESIDKPKEFLEDFVRMRIKKRYINVVHNPMIAQNIDIKKVLKCPSFVPLYEYIKET